MNRREARINRVYHCLQTANIAFEWRELDDNTATSKSAADALDCQTAEIAKSIVFRRCRDNIPIVVVLCGNNRVSTDKLRAAVGAAVDKADADFVRENCGFEIGGVAPLAHDNDATIIFIDHRLYDYPMIWAAAGSAYVVFGTTPQDLQKAAAARIADLAE